MTFTLSAALMAKREARRLLAARPTADKLRILETLRIRDRVLGRAAVHDERAPRDRDSAAPDVGRLDGR